MSNPHRILVVVGTRPEAIKLAPVVSALRAEPWAQVRVVATAQHRELLDQALAWFGITPDRDLSVMQPDQSLADLTARLTAALEPALAAEQPDLVVAQGDTTTVLVTALSCFYRDIPFAHVEAGLRSGDLHDPFPEEMNRVLAGRLATLHFAPTDGARDNLLREGADGRRVHVTGNTGIDALLQAVERADPAPFAPPRGKRLLLVTAHRRESFGPPLVSLCRALRRLADRGDVQVLWPLHPNPNLEAAHALRDHAAIRLAAPLDYPEMVAAMRASHLILTDSGGVQEEAPSLGKPVLVLRRATERPEGVAAGAARLVGTDEDTVVAAATELLDDGSAYRRMAQVRNPYGDGRAAQRITQHLRAFLGA